MWSHLTMKSEMLQSLTEQNPSQQHSINKVETLKLKAANFPMKVLRIGFFNVEAKYPSDLIAKCYYARQKLVWEILIDGLQNKIEIQWQHISAIRALISENSQGILEIELNKVPSFFRETERMPRKHTKWTSSEDFTNGQASLYRIHHLEFDTGVLDQHYGNLLRCNKRLLELSQKPFPSSNSAYFDSYLNQRTTHSSFGHNLNVNESSQSAFVSEEQPIVVSPQEVQQTSVNNHFPFLSQQQSNFSLMNEVTGVQMLQDQMLTPWSQGFYRDTSLPCSSNVTQHQYGLGAKSQPPSHHVSDDMLRDYCIPNIEFDKSHMGDIIKSSNAMVDYSNTSGAQDVWPHSNENLCNASTHYTQHHQQQQQQQHHATDANLNYMQEDTVDYNDQCWFYPDEMLPQNIMSDNDF